MKKKNYLLIFSAVILYYSIQETSATLMESEATRINFDVTVIEPTCHFTYSNKVDFAEVERSMLINTQLLQPITLKLTDCSAAQVDISFTGQYVDYHHNYIINRNGQEFAQGVAIKLLDSREREFPLGQPYIIHDVIQGENMTHDVSLFAKLIAISGSEEVTLGEIRTSVDLSVTYK